MKTLKQQAEDDTERAMQFNRVLTNIQTGHFGVSVDHNNIMRNVKEKGTK